jgi:arylsulfatase A-like enzyme
VSNGERRIPLPELALEAGKAQLVQETLPCEPREVCRLEIASEGQGTASIEELTLRFERPRSPASRAVPGRPNVIIFLVDAMRADFAGAYGHPAPTSPRFDAFAREAVLFEDATAQTSWTRPAVASLLTGLDVEAHGVGGVTNTLVPEITTLAEAFRSAGYATGAFVANGIVNRQLGYDQGFQAWNEGGRLDSKHAAEVVDAALHWMDSRDASRPFFLYVHTIDPHKPYVPAPEHHAPFLFPGYAGERNPLALVAKPRLEPDELRYLRSTYQGEVHQSDAAFGGLLDGLFRRGLEQRCVIAFTADHGEEFLDHGGFGHSGTLYHELLHIPLAIRAPGSRRAGQRDPTPVAQVDVAPTLLALAGVAPPPEIQGRDLSARCLGPTAFAEEPALLVSRLTYADADKLAARLGPLKLIVNREPGRDAGSRLELYDLAQDPAELHNVAAERPFAARYLLSEAAQATDVSHRVRMRLRAGRESPPTPEQLEQLKALGYVQ